MSLLTKRPGMTNLIWCMCVYNIPYRRLEIRLWILIFGKTQIYLRSRGVHGTRNFNFADADQLQTDHFKLTHDVCFFRCHIDLGTP